MISFHSRVKNAKKFSEEIISLQKNFDDKNFPKNEFYSDYVEGMKMTTSERTLKLKKLGMTRKNQISLLSNAKCLSEGIDVPTLDAVAFIDPKNSIIDIVQQLVEL